MSERHATINRIATAVPDHDVHRFYIDFALSLLADKKAARSLFQRMVESSGIEHRFSCFEPARDPHCQIVDRAGDFVRGAFPGTAVRMERYASVAPILAKQAIDGLELGADAAGITHLIVTSCTGFAAPGIDLDLVEACGLPTSVERTIIGFMGCYAAINALKLARHIVRSDPAARVLTVNIELCTLHLRETTDLEQLLSFCLWGDGCAAALITAEQTGIRLDGFQAFVLADRRELMSWKIRDDGFEMVLSGQVPGAIREALKAGQARILGGRTPDEIALWAVHPGGRSVLDAVERAYDLPAAALDMSRSVLRRFGNMSSATVMFVLAEMLAGAAGLPGCAMAFGPGLTAETMTFHTVS